MTPPNPICSVTLFGRVAICRPGEPELVIGGPSAKILVCLGVHAAVSGEWSTVRTRVARAVYDDWDGDNYEDVSNKFGVAAKRFRKTVGPVNENLLIYDKEQKKLGLNAELLTIDAFAFRLAFKDAETVQDTNQKIEKLLTAVNTSRGDIQTCEIRDDWFRGECKILRQWQFDARYQLALCYEALGNAREALEYIRQALMVDPISIPARKFEAQLQQVLASSVAQWKPKHNLEISSTSFIERNTEIHDIAHLLETANLVTLAGTGGTGKTRLAQEVARSILTRFPDGVWLVELSEMSGAGSILHAIAETVGWPTQKDVTEENLADYLQPKNMLLVLESM